MKSKVILSVIILVLLALTLTSCGDLPTWKIADEGNSCTPATVADKDWSDGDRDNFYILLRTDDGEMGMAVVNAYVYYSLEVGQETCAIRK